MTFPIVTQWRCGEASPGQRFVSPYWERVHHRMDGQRLEALLMWPEIDAVLGARPSTWGLEVQCGLVHASFQRFCMRSRDLIMRCIVYWEVWRIYLFYTLLWILRESTRAFGLNRRYSHWVWHCDRPDSLRRYGWDEELWIVLVQLILSDWGGQLLCDKMLRHYEDNAFIILTSVSECDWHQVCQLCEPDVYSGLWASVLWSCLFNLSSGMWVGDCSGRYMTTEQLYWSQLALRMSNRTFYSPSWLEVERRRFYATSWFGDETPCFWECLFACQRVTHTLSLVLFLRSWIL